MAFLPGVLQIEVGIIGARLEPGVKVAFSYRSAVEIPWVRPGSMENERGRLACDAGCDRLQIADDVA
jgi:hypothetical protein